MYKRNDLTRDSSHIDYIWDFSDLEQGGYTTIIKSIGALNERVECGYKQYETSKGKRAGKKLYTYKNLTCAFDIETSTVNTVNLVSGITDFYSAMYVCQFAIQNHGIRFRRWSEVRDFFIKFPKLLGLHKDEVLLTWVHNLDYETSYLKHRFNIDGNTFFGKSRQKPIRYMLENNILMHDSYSVTNSSLEMLGKMYDTKHQKAVGDLDHTKLRNYLTPLSRKDDKYIFNDVFVLTDFAAKIFELYNFVPDTATQILSKEVAAAVIEHGAEFVGQERWDKWSELSDHDILKRVHGYIFGYQYTINGLIRHVKGLVDPDMFTPFNEIGLPPPPDGLKSGNKVIYDMYKWLYRGGYSKSNARYTSTDSYLVHGVQQRVGGYDYTSSYPFCQTAFNFPVSRFTVWNGDPDELTLKYDHTDFEDYRYIFICEFTEIESINDFALESESKCKCTNPCIDNGRILSADRLLVCLTDCDYALYKKYYTWHDRRIIKAWRAKAGKLPDFLLYPLWDNGRKKQELKHNDAKKTEYNIAKANFNSFYGLCCKQPVYINYYYDNTITETGYIATETDVRAFFGTKQDYTHILDNDDEMIAMGDLSNCDIEDFKETTKSFILSPFWGIWVSAFARYNILNLIWEIGENSDWITNDCIYCDTDSVYYINPDNHSHIIERWNTWAAERVAQRLPAEYIQSLGSLGQLDNIAKDEHCVDDTFINFKTLGSKRYIKEYQLADRKVIKATVAGLPKGVLERFCKRLKLDIYEQFSNLMDFTVDSDDLEQQEKVKLGRKYHDEKMTFYIEWVKVTEYSSCTLYPTTFTLKVKDLYVNHINNFRRRVGGGKDWSIYGN